MTDWHHHYAWTALLSFDPAFNFVTVNRHFLCLAVVFSVQLHAQSAAPASTLPTVDVSNSTVSQNRVGGFPGSSDHVSGASATKLLAVLAINIILILCLSKQF